MIEQYTTEELVGKILPPCDREMHLHDAVVYAACEIVSQMSDDDLRSYTASSWREGVSLMLVDAWEGLPLEEIIGVMTAAVRLRNGHSDEEES